MDSPAVSKPLRFGCPACGIRLVVDQSIAGTEGPCPSCGARIVAPPVEAAQSLVEKQAEPVAIKPRPAGGKQFDAESGAAVTTPASNRDEPAQRPPRSQRRSVSPTTIMSDKYAEKQNAFLFFKILAAVLVVAVIAFGTFYILKNAS